MMLKLGGDRLVAEMRAREGSARCRCSCYLQKPTTRSAIGGDFFSVTTIDDRLCVAIADVCGKGISAAIMAAQLQGMIHEDLLSRVPLSEIASRANQYFCPRSGLQVCDAGDRLPVAHGRAGVPQLRARAAAARLMWSSRPPAST
jgi:hypothetical protein